MLPVYTQDKNESLGFGHFRAPASHAYATHKRRRVVRRLVQLSFLGICVVLPMWLVFKGHISAPMMPYSNRKMLSEQRIDLLPAAPLKNLVLVAGHAVYTGIDFSEAAKESSWFLEPYQQVEGELINSTV